MSLQIREDICGSGNSYDGENLSARISSVFVVFGVSAIGSFLPLIALNSPFFKVPGWIFFVLRYIGSGVIVATGFIHLLAEASSALSEECLGSPFVDYPWAEGIALMGVFLMFFFDIVAHKKIEEKIIAKSLLTSQALNEGEEIEPNDNDNDNDNDADVNKNYNDNTDKEFNDIDKEIKTRLDIFEHNGYHCANKGGHNHLPTKEKNQNFYHQILNSFILEFGIIFHSVFVGLSLAIAGEEFVALYIAIAFHQMFEGLGLGTRFALTPWPENKKYIPWCLSLAYSLTTPVAIAIGLGVRKSYPPGSRTALITTGIFDALCGGILIYNSLVELMAYDFIYSSEFKDQKGMSKMLIAYFCLAIGAFAMALIGKWA